MYVWTFCPESLETPEPSAEAAKPSASIATAAKELGKDVLKLLVLVPRLRALQCTT